MTSTLVIDTATNRTIVGIVSDGAVVFEKFHEGATDHGIALSQLVEEALAHTPEIDRVVVGMGPGPFTGLRVGIAFAHAFALTRTIPVIGICSLDAIEVDHPNYTIAIDARRKEIYWARYENSVRVEGPSVNKPDEVNDFIIERYPSVARLAELAESQNISEPLYLRRPDAVPTAERA
jgi:tRNA threonylcarbamoyl adenosine modification protein YeaZ